MKIAICVPHAGTMKAKTAFALIRMFKNCPYEWDYLDAESSILHINREKLVKKALELGDTHILFVDTDMFFEKDALAKLLSRDKDIIGAAYNRRQLPLISAYEGVLEDYGDLLRCTGIGMGFTLIKAEVFKKIDHPWFLWESDKEGNLVTGEDFYFCHRAKEAGYEIWIDKSITIKHLGEYQY